MANNQPHPWIVFDNTSGQFYTYTDGQREACGSGPEFVYDPDRKIGYRLIDEWNAKHLPSCTYKFSS